jgi:hypothetical protein
MRRIWSILINTFLVATETSYKLAVRISTKHDAALQAAAASGDAFFVAMYAAYHPIHLALVAAYDIWIAHDGTQQSQTLTLTQLLRLLSGTKAEQWMVMVKIVYGKDTARFKEIFPHLKSVLQEGTQQARIDAVKAMSIAIGADASLTGVKSDVDTFYTSLLNANTTQKGSKSTTGTMSGDIETARVNSAVGQFADYGGLIQKYAATPEVVGNYFDEAGIRKGNQVIFHHHVRQTKVYTLCKHTSVAADEYLLENECPVDLWFAFVLHKGDVPTTVYVLVPANSDKTVHASDLTSDLLNNHYLVCYNPSATVEGLFTVEML